MKKAFLTTLFTTYILFLPFIVVNCSLLHPEDAPYNKLDDGSDAEASDEEILADCENRDYLTADCVSVLQDESDRIATEQATVTAAARETTDLIQCQDVMEEEALDAADTTDDAADASATETTTTETVDCDTTLTDILAAVQICEADTSGDYADNCAMVDDVINSELFNCDAAVEETYFYSESDCSDATPTTGSFDYCASLVSTLYDECHPAAGETVASGFSCTVLDHIYDTMLCECKKETPSITDSICSSVTGKQTATESNIESTD